MQYTMRISTAEPRSFFDSDQTDADDYHSSTDELDGRHRLTEYKEREYYSNEREQVVRERDCGHRQFSYGVYIDDLTEKDAYQSGNEYQQAYCRIEICL